MHLEFNNVGNCQLFGSMNIGNVITDYYDNNAKIFYFKERDGYTKLDLDSQN